MQERDRFKTGLNMILIEPSKLRTNVVGWKENFIHTLTANDNFFQHSTAQTLHLKWTCSVFAVAKLTKICKF